MDQDTLRTKAELHVGFYKLSDTKTGRAVYPKAWVEEYKRWREGPRKTRFPELMSGPKLDWPDEAPLQEITAKAAIVMIERWKYRELYRLCEAICGRTYPREKLLAYYHQQRRILLDPDGNRRSLDDPALSSALDKKISQLVMPAGTIVDTTRLRSLMRTVWEHVLEAQKGWLLSTSD